MEVVSCYCKKCDSEVGRFRNAWNGIGNTYFSPVYPPLCIDGITATGDIYEAARDSQIEDSLLQDISCDNCRAVFGLRCEKAPDGHLLKKNQLILRLSEMYILSEASGRKAKISVLKSFPLTYAPGLRRTSNAKILSSMPTPRPKRVNSFKPDQTPAKEVSHTPQSTTSAVTDMAILKSWAENTINLQRKDIERLSETLCRIDRDMMELKEFIKEVRADLSSLGRVCSQENNKDKEVANLRRELSELRQQINRNGGILYRKSLNVVVEGVKCVARKAEEVDDLKAELEAMNSQIMALEATQRSKVTPSPSDTLQLRRTRLSSLDKRKYDDDNDGYTIHVVRAMDGPEAKRRKVSAAVSPHVNLNAEAESKRAQYTTSYQQSIPLGSSLDHGSSLSRTSRRDDAETSIHKDFSIKNVPELSTQVVASTNSQTEVAASSNSIVEINTPMLPSMIMPLRNGTIFGADNRNELLDVSHIEAATGLKRDDHGRWLRPLRNVDKHPASSRQVNALGINAIFANGLIGNAEIAAQERENKRTLGPKKDQSKTKPNTTIKIETYDGPSDDRHCQSGKEEENRDEDQDAGEQENRGAEKEYTVPPIVVYGTFDPEDLTKIFECGV